MLKRMLHCEELPKAPLREMKLLSTMLKKYLLRKENLHAERIFVKHLGL